MSTFNPNFALISATDVFGNSFQLPDQGLLSKIYYPQVVTSSGFFQPTDITWPDGYVGYTYTAEQTFAGASAVTLQSGSLPPGLTLTQPAANKVRLSGTPTTAGTYNFTLRATSGLTYTDYTNHVTISPDPDQGAGGVGGG